jgi:hypothetical protein
MKEVMPKPSQPSRRIIRWGMKINRFIDRINRITRIVNRVINLSSDIYDEENFSTLAEINRTVLENKRPMGSQTRVRRIGVLEMGIITHSRRIVELLCIDHSVEGSKINRRSSHI